MLSLTLPHSERVSKQKTQDLEIETKNQDGTIETCKNAEDGSKGTMEKKDT